ncbi:unnamed protein product [Schistosoma margrebowiei]|uniref:Uncharacterized protein n=1 Tax=Schistosoma margrebowiei TaxID=48269 RepID=A0A183MSG8_9TREM|nr:unnamed protein product [Schistosoma margrebowiei]
MLNHSNMDGSVGTPASMLKSGGDYMCVLFLKLFAILIFRACYRTAWKTTHIIPKIMTGPGLIPNRHHARDLDFSDDLALLLHTQQQIQEKTTSVVATSEAVGLTIRNGKSKILRYNTTYNNPITFDGEELEDVKTSTYLGSIIDEKGGSDADVKARVGKARVAYLQLKDIWNSKQPSASQHQGRDFQEKSQDSYTVWGRNLENEESRHPEGTSVY